MEKVEDYLAHTEMDAAEIITREEEHKLKNAFYVKNIVTEA